LDVEDAKEENEIPVNGDTAGVDEGDSIRHVAPPEPAFEDIRCVTKNRELAEQRIKRNEERIKREEEIKTIQHQLQNESASKAAEHREKLEVALKAAQDAIEILDIEDSKEKNGALSKGDSVGVKESYSKHPTSTAPSIPEPLIEPAAFPSAAEEHSEPVVNVIVDDEVKEHDSERTNAVTPETAPMAVSSAAEALVIEDAKENDEKFIEGDATEVKQDDRKLVVTEAPEAPRRISFAPGTNSQQNESASRPKMQRTKTAYLREQIALMQQEAADREMSMEKMNALMKEEEKENQERIRALEAHIQSLAREESGRDKLLNHWQTKGKMLSSKCLSLKGNVDEREKSLEELEEFKMMQEERIASLEAKESAPPPPRPSMKGSRRFSTRASIDPSFRLGLQRAATKGDINDQMREEAKLEMAALEEQLAMMDGEKGELLAELEAMKAILAATEVKSSKKKSERLVYQLSCKKCNKHGSFVGATDQGLKTMLDQHFEKVVAEAKKKKKSENVEKAKKGEAWHGEFAQHFAKHTKKKFGKTSEKDIIKFCRQNVKVEVLRRGDGAALMWEEDD